MLFFVNPLVCFCITAIYLALLGLAIWMMVVYIRRRKMEKNSFYLFLNSAIYQVSCALAILFSPAYPHVQGTMLEKVTSLAFVYVSHLFATWLIAFLIHRYANRPRFVEEADKKK